MAKLFLLIISDDDQRVEKIRTLLPELVTWGIIAGTSLFSADFPTPLLNADLLLIDLDGLNVRTEGLAWVALCGDLFRPIAVITLSEVYDEAEALIYFGNGVSDYLSLADHSERFATVISTIALEGAVAERASFAGET